VVHGNESRRQSATWPRENRADHNFGHDHRVCDIRLASAPTAITAGPDGALWFTESEPGRIGRILTSGAINDYVIPVGAGGVIVQPEDIAAGLDGALWFCDFTALADPTRFSGNIGRITTSSAITQYTLPGPTGTVPRHIAAGSDGTLWFTDGNIGRITTSRTFTEYPVSGGGAIGSIAAGPDGALWFTETGTNKIGRVTTNGAITEFPVPTAGSTPQGIAAGPDGALWFTEQMGNKIGRITTDGAISEFSIPTVGSSPRGIAAGPDGAMWFTEADGNNIGRMTIPASTSPLVASRIALEPIGRGREHCHRLRHDHQMPARSQ
jgi:virginiamycin B lyase